jgi:hypothetical protein
MTRRQVATILEAGVVALALLSLGTLWDGPLPTRKMGSLGEWLSGIGAAAAVLTAIWTVRTESDRSRHDERNRREAEARSVIIGDPRFMLARTTATTSTALLGTSRPALFV